YCPTGYAIDQYRVQEDGTLEPLTPATAPAGPGPYSITFSLDGRFAYAGDDGDGAIWQYRVKEDGALTPLVPPSVAGGAGILHQVTLSPDGRFAYMANRDANTVAQYRVGTDGALYPLDPPTIPAGDEPVGFFVSPSGRFAYAPGGKATGAIYQYKVGLSGRLEPLAKPVSTENDLSAGLAFAHAGTCAYVTCWFLVHGRHYGSVRQYRVLGDGQLVPFSTPRISAGIAPFPPEILPSGEFAYVHSRDGIWQFRITPAGSLQPLSPDHVALDENVTQMALDPESRAAYVGNWDSGEVQQYHIGMDGRLTPFSPDTVDLGLSPNTGPIFTDPSGRFAYVGSSRDGKIAEMAIQKDGSLKVVGTAPSGGGEEIFFLELPQLKNGTSAGR
ncbi:MAG: lactonase family protein, partial [Armatimonadota bacterium]|nr:lactonase family protein [Armatimonadota bacterium]